MELGMVQLGNAARSTPCFNEKRSCKLEAHGSARHSQFILYAQKALEQETINKLS